MLMVMGFVGTKSMEFLEWYGSVGISLPYDLSVSYYFGYSPTGFSNNYDYTYHNVGAEIPVPGTPFTYIWSCRFYRFRHG